MTLRKQLRKQTTHSFVFLRTAHMNLDMPVPQLLVKAMCMNMLINVGEKNTFGAPPTCLKLAYFAQFYKFTRNLMNLAQICRKFPNFLNLIIYVETLSNFYSLNIAPQKIYFEFCQNFGILFIFLIREGEGFAPLSSTLYG